MTQQTLRLGLLLSILCLPGCGILVGHTGETHRVTAAQLEEIREGMTIEQAWKVLGRPWQIVVDGFGGPREVHRFRMNGESYQEEVESRDFETDEVVIDTVTLTQLRIVELTFDKGKLVQGKLVKGNE